MAITKKHVDLQNRKAAIRAEIRDLHARCIEATKAVPASVIGGSQQVAATWRDAAENLVFGAHAFGGERATVGELDKIKDARAALLCLLEGGQTQAPSNGGAEAPVFELIG